MSDAPKTITSLLIDRPAVNADGTLAPWLAQVLQRILGFIGPVGGTTGTGAGSGGNSITDEITDIQQALLTAGGASGADGASLARIGALERVPPPLPSPPPLPPTPGSFRDREGALPPAVRLRPPPLPPFPPQADPSGFLDQAFGNVEGSILYRGPTTWLVLPPGTAGQKLTSGGAGAPVSWV